MANGLSIRVKRGQTVALVGPSGCGKSTVVQLLQRFYDPLSGGVYIDDNDIREVCYENRRFARGGLINTEYQLIAVTLAKNINSDDASDNRIEIVRTIQIVKIINYVSIQLTYINFIKWTFCSCKRSHLHNFRVSR